MSLVAPRVSFVVPTKNSSRTLTRCLEHLRSQTYANHEIIVVDNHSSDGTATQAAALADVFVQAGPERSAQRNLGLQLATGDVVAFIDSDMYVTPNVASEAVAHLCGDDVAGVIIPEVSTGEGFFARCRAHEKRLYLGNRDVEAARFFLTSHVREIGGYCEGLRAGEDWDLADRFEAEGHKIGRTDAVIVHDDGRVSLHDVFVKKQYYGTSFADYLEVRSGGRPRRLLRPELLGRAPELLRRPLLTAGLVLLKGVETAGLARGVWRGRRSR